MRVLNHFNNGHGIIESDFGLLFLKINGYYIENKLAAFGLSFRQIIKLLKQFYDQFNIDRHSCADIDGQWIFYPKFNNNNDNNNNSIRFGRRSNAYPTLTKFQHQQQQQLQQIQKMKQMQQQQQQLRLKKHDQTNTMSYYQSEYDLKMLRLELEYDIIKVFEKFKYGIIEHDFCLYMFFKCKQT